MSAEKKIKKVALMSRTRSNRTTACELIKDAQQLTAQSRVLQEQAQHLREQSRRILGLTASKDSSKPHAVPPKALTVTEACRHLGVCEHTLRRALREPELRTRVAEQSRCAGLYHKFVLVLPLDLIADLSARFAQRKTPKMESRKV